MNTAKIERLMTRVLGAVIMCLSFYFAWLIIFVGLTRYLVGPGLRGVDIVIPFILAAVGFAFGTGGYQCLRNPDKV